MSQITADPTEARLIRKLVDSGGYTPDEAVAAVRKVHQDSQASRSATEAPPREESPISPQTERTEAPTASRVIRVTVPMAPAKELMPNQQTKQSHWSTRSKARRAFREAVAWDAAQAMPHTWQAITGPVSLAIHVAWPKRRRPDIDAVVASCKSGIDGLEDAGIFADDKQIIELTATHEYGASGSGTTQFTIQEIAP